MGQKGSFNGNFKNTYILNANENKTNQNTYNALKAVTRRKIIVLHADSKREMLFKFLL